MAICYTIVISLLTVRETKILSLTHQGGVTDTTFKTPLKNASNGYEKEVGIYTSISRPKEVHNFDTETLIFWY